MAIEGSQLEVLDIVIIVLNFVFVLALGIWVSEYQHINIIKWGLSLLYNV